MNGAGTAVSPDTGPEAQAALRAGLRALGLPEEEGRIAAMLRYLALLRRWNASYNLTAVREPGAMVTHHLLDCLAAVAALQRSPVAATVRRILDVGSGGGLPGLVLALCEPAWAVTCIDAVAKKAAFVRQAAGVLGLPNVNSVHGRVEQLRGEQFDLITARAFTTLAELTRLTQPLLAPGGCWLAMKGQLPEGEIAALPQGIEVFHVEPLVVPGLAAQRCLVWVRPRRGV